MNYLKLYGLKRTGTNYLRYLLESNFRDTEVLMDVLGWKHGYPTRHHSLNWEHWYPEWKPEESPVSDLKIQDILSSGLRYILIMKDPYAWLDSMARYERQEIVNLSHLGLAYRASHWSAIMNTYSRFLDEKKEDCTYVRYEDLPESILPVGEKFSLDRTEETLVDSEFRFERGNDTVSPEACMTDERFSKRETIFYQDQLECINQYLDNEMMLRFKYDYME